MPLENLLRVVVVVATWNVERKMEKYRTKNKSNLFHNQCMCRVCECAACAEARDTHTSHRKYVTRAKRIWKNLFNLTNTFVQTFAFIRSNHHQPAKATSQSASNENKCVVEMRENTLNSFIWFSVGTLRSYEIALGRPQHKFFVLVAQKNKIMHKPNENRRMICHVHTRACVSHKMRLCQSTYSWNNGSKDNGQHRIFLSLMPFWHFHSVNMPLGHTPTPSCVHKSDQMM